MMHLCLLRDGITPLRNAQHSHSHPVLLTHLRTPSAPISFQGGQVCLIIDLVHNHCILAVCQTVCWHKARPQMEPESLCTSSSTSSTGPRCRTFTYTERLSNVHWQLANTEHLQQLLLSASSSNTHRRVSNYAHFLIRTHTHAWPIHNHPSNRLYLAAGVKASFSSTIRNSYMSTDSHSVFLNDVVLANHISNMIIIDSSCIVCSPSPH